MQRASLANVAHSQDVVWENDKDASYCNGCRERFSLFNRRHHCRRCGLIFCANCSFHSISLPYLGFREAVRVCSPCYRIETDRRNSSQKFGGSSLRERDRSRFSMGDRPAAPPQLFVDHTPPDLQLAEYKQLVLEQQQTIEVLMQTVKLRGNEEDQHLINQLLEQPMEPRGRSLSTPGGRKYSRSFNSGICTSLESDYRTTMSLQDSTMHMPLEGTTPPLDELSPKVILAFDEDIVNALVKLGHSRKEAIVTLLDMSENGVTISLEAAIDRINKRDTRGSQKEAELKSHLKEIESRLMEMQKQLKEQQLLDVQKEDEIQTLKGEIEQLQRVRHEKDTQIEILTGGFGFHNYMKVHTGVDIMEETECIICMDNGKDYRTSCGCKVMCGSCYKKLKKKECPSCGKQIK